MPFVNDDQRRACYAEKKNNPNSTWDCEKFEGGHTKMRRKRKTNRKR